MKTAIILMNLGGPDKPESIKPFLFNLFNDKAIIPWPQPFRSMLAWLISTLRNKKAMHIYQFLGGGSPLLANTKAQAQALEEALKKDESVGEFKTFIAMRYWHPLTEEALLQAKEWGAERVVLLPLYPQFSTTTTGSSFKAWKHLCKKHQWNVPTFWNCCYPDNKGWLKASEYLLEQEIQKALPHGRPWVLFSAHGLPESIINAGDPYQHQVEVTAQHLERAIRAKGYDNFDAVVCYQSRVGPKKWIGPNTEDVLMEKAPQKRPIVVHPLAFVSEHSETLVELDIEYKEVVDEKGPAYYGRVSTVGEHPEFIQGLRDIVHHALNGRQEFHCPEGWAHCYCQHMNQKAS
jgi:ferrochelatase